MIVLVALSAAGIACLDRSLTTVIPTVPAPDSIEIFFDRTPVTITFTIADQRGHRPLAIDCQPARRLRP